MCLYPRLLKNPKYKSTKKNGGEIPEMKDPRVMWVPVGCQKCMECKKQKARQWQVRLSEEVRTDKTGKFVTLTFSNESIRELIGAIAQENDGAIPEGYLLDNEIATLAVRRFLERWRKKYKKSVKHWLITEIGQGTKWKYKGTENIHLHGIIFTDKVEDITKIWRYGYVFIGTYVTERTVNYMTKYVTKPDEIHKEYQPKVLTSAGIGSNYINRQDAGRNKYTPLTTKETYVLKNGTKINLPVYYRNKIYTEDERELLWLEKLDKQIRWVNGEKIDISTERGQAYYYETLKRNQEKNIRLGYGNNNKNWEQVQYENDRRNKLIKKRLEKLDNDRNP